MSRTIPALPNRAIDLRRIDLDAHADYMKQRITPITQKVLLDIELQASAARVMWGDGSPLLRTLRDAARRLLELETLRPPRK